MTLELDQSYKKHSLQALTFLDVLNLYWLLWQYVYAFGFLNQGGILTVLFTCAAVFLKYIGYTPYSLPL